MNLKEFVYALLVDYYSIDQEDPKPMKRLYMQRRIGSKFPNEIKSMISQKKTRFWIDAYAIKCLTGWLFTIHEDKESSSLPWEEISVVSEVSRVCHKDSLF